MDQPQLINENDDNEVQEPIYKGQPISAPTTVIGLLNGMLGGTCLVLPQLGIATGWATSIMVCLGAGFIAYYTASLIILHLGQGSQIRDCVMAHFKNDYRYMRMYSFFMWVSFIPVFLIYYETICLQVEGLLGYQSVWVGPLTSIMLFMIILIIRMVHVGQEVLAIGILSIISYICFLLWSHFTSPSGPRVVPTFGYPELLAATLLMAFSIHDFLVQNIIKNPNKQQYQCIVNTTFIAGTLAYIYIALASFCIYFLIKQSLIGKLI